MCTIPTTFILTQLVDVTDGCKIPLRFAPSVSLFLFFSPPFFLKYLRLEVGSNLVAVGGMSVSEICGLI